MKQQALPGIPDQIRFKPVRKRLYDIYIGKERFGRVEYDIPSHSWYGAMEWDEGDSRHAYCTGPQPTRKDAVANLFKRAEGLMVSRLTGGQE